MCVFHRKQKYRSDLYFCCQVTFVKSIPFFKKIPPKSSNIDHHNTNTSLTDNFFLCFCVSMIPILRVFTLENVETFLKISTVVNLVIILSAKI